MQTNSSGRYQLEPLICLAHEVEGPCLRCLIPEVMRRMTEKDGKNSSRATFPVTINEANFDWN